MGILVCRRHPRWEQTWQCLFWRVSSSSHCQIWIVCTETELHRDTGYRAVPIGVGDKGYDEEYLDSLPHCPAFKGT